MLIKNEQEQDMIDLFYASSNDSKIQNLKNWLAKMPIRILTPKDFCLTINVTESGNSVVENAVLKVTAYRDVLAEGPWKGIPILAHDTGLYIDGLSEEEQPGIFVRRRGDFAVTDIARRRGDSAMTDFTRRRGDSAMTDFTRHSGDHTMTDQEALEYYCRLVRERGQIVSGKRRMTARYLRGGALLIDGTVQTKEFPAPEMWLLDEPCREYTEKGNPLDVSTLDPKTGKYWCDLSVSERDDAYGDFGTKIGEWILESLRGNQSVDPE